MKESNWKKEALRLELVGRLAEAVNALNDARFKMDRKTKKSYFESLENINKAKRILINLEEYERNREGNDFTKYS